MEALNYERVRRMFPAKRSVAEDRSVMRHKSNRSPVDPKVSIVLLDWSCRERLHALDWLHKQDVPRETYEIIWVELHHRVLAEVLDKTDVVLTLHQKGMYHKHKGYNAGVLAARGEIVTVCDSDAVFPRDFISSILNSFCEGADAPPRPLVLMHHQRRTLLTYPDGLEDADDLKDAEKWQWWPLNPNAGACVSIRKKDVIRYGGFDEHKSYRGYICGPYDLAWRLVNAGVLQVWHDLSTVLWHFAHPDPVGKHGIVPSLRRMLENTWPHVDMHALTAVEHFSTGRMLPLKENPQIHALRMADRRIGTEFERKYAELTPPEGFSKWQICRLRLGFLWNLAMSMLWGGRPARLLKPAARMYRRWRPALPQGACHHPLLVSEHKHANIVKFQSRYYLIPKSLGPVNLMDEEQRQNPKIVCSESWHVLKRLARRAA